jgi:hypothetical protein
MDPRKVDRGARKYIDFRRSGRGTSNDIIILPSPVYLLPDSRVLVQIVVVQLHKTWEFEIRRRWS